MLDGEGEEEESPQYEVRQLAADEELVIDGETAVDDLLVAQRIAALDSAVNEELAENAAASSAGATGVPRRSRPAKVQSRTSPAAAAPSREDLAKLLQLLQQTNDLSNCASLSTIFFVVFRFVGFS